MTGRRRRASAPSFALALAAAAALHVVAWYGVVSLREHTALAPPFAAVPTRPPLRVTLREAPAVPRPAGGPGTESTNEVVVAEAGAEASGSGTGGDDGGALKGERRTRAGSTSKAQRRFGGKADGNPVPKAESRTDSKAESTAESPSKGTPAAATTGSTGLPTIASDGHGASDAEVSSNAPPPPPSAAGTVDPSSATGALPSPRGVRRFLPQSDGGALARYRADGETAGSPDAAAAKLEARFVLTRRSFVFRRSYEGIVAGGGTEEFSHWVSRILGDIELHFDVPRSAFAEKQAALFLYDLLASPPSCAVTHRRVRGSGLPEFDAKMDSLVERAIASIGPLEPRGAGCGGPNRGGSGGGAVRLGLAMVVFLGDDPEFSEASLFLGELFQVKPSKNGRDKEYYFNVLPLIQRLFD